MSTNPMNQPDLFDALAADSTPEGMLHAILPNMGLACGLDILAVFRQGDLLDRKLTTLGTYSEVTCPDCLARGDLAAIARQMMGHQAPHLD